PDFELGSDNAVAVAQICRRMDGLPLALELAAGRMGVMSPADLAERLSWPFRLLHSREPAGEGRHRTLRAMIDWSYRLLDDPTARVFEVVSVFAGSFDLESAERLIIGVSPLCDRLRDRDPAD